MTILPSRVGALVTALALSTLLAGCGGGSAGSVEDGTRVVASFYPLQYVAERVVGEDAEVENLTAPGLEPHDLELTVRQTAEIAEAGLAFYQKGFQPAVDEAVAQADPAHVVETTEIVPLEDGDPHVWLDPAKLSKIAAGFTEEMAAVDPSNAKDYRANLADLEKDLAALDGEFRTGLSQCAVDTVVVSHDAFGYLEKYGLHFDSIAGLSPDAEPSPAHIRELHDLIETEQISTVFSETLASPKMSETIADDLGLGTGVLDPIEGLSERTADEDYLSLMRSNLAALKKANGCR